MNIINLFLTNKPDTQMSFSYCKIDWQLWVPSIFAYWLGNSWLIESTFSKELNLNNSSVFYSINYWKLWQARWFWFDLKVSVDISNSTKYKKAAERFKVHRSASLVFSQKNYTLTFNFKAYQTYNWVKPIRENEYNIIEGKKQHAK